MKIKKFIVGIDMGGSDIKAALIDDNFDIVQSYEWTENSRILTRNMKPYEWIRIISSGLENIRKELSDMGGGEIDVIGISTPGIPNPEYSAIRFMPGRLQELEGLVWSDHLPFSEPIPVLNDAKAALLGEMLTPQLSACRNIFMLTLGTGIGGAAIVDGHLLEGHLGRFGHFGHSCIDIEGEMSIAGMPGALDIKIGNCSISKRTYGLYDSPEELLKAHKAGDPIATEHWLKLVKATAVGICSLINILDPEKVILGGGIAKAGPDLFIPLRKYMDLFEWRLNGKSVEIIPATKGNFAGALGAGLFAHNKKYKKGHQFID